MRKNKVAVSINTKIVFDKEDNHNGAFGDGGKAITCHIWNEYWQTISKAKEGDKGEIQIKFAWKCTLNRRAAPRPKHVIAAEKAASAAKGAARRARSDEWKKEAEIRKINLRMRIKSQVDHAFAVGKHGTEPAAKYITCQHCDAPAALVTLSQKVAPGAAVLDEDTITGAVCTAHGQWVREEKISCSKLEFFYDGIRQIAIKP
jgi:hypothetical protein